MNLETIGTALFLLLLVFSAFCLRVAICRRKTYALDHRELCFIVLLSYILFFVSSIPFVWFEGWNLTRHALCVFVFGLTAFCFTVNRLTSATFSIHGKLSKEASIFLIIWAIGIFLQWKPVFYLYGTHDPGAYLSAALHLNSKGTFTHYDEISIQAYTQGREELKSLLFDDEFTERWQTRNNYGLLPDDTPFRGVSHYHGMFGTSLWLAIGIKLFGEGNCTRINWLHLGTCLLFLSAILRFLGVQAMWRQIGTLLFVISPLIATLFREPLSEPLSLALFLGIVFCFLDTTDTRDPRSMVCFLLGGCCMLFARLNGFLLLPFIIGASVFLQYQALPKPGRLPFWLGTIALYFLCGITAYHANPGYVWALFKSYLEMFGSLSHKLYSSVLIRYGLLVTLVLALIVGKWVWRYRKQRSFQSLAWKSLWNLYAIILFASLAFCYGWALLRWRNQIGGFPFVIYPPDSVLFYVGPILIVVGCMWWWEQMRRQPVEKLSFLQSYVPFIVVFYLLLHFGPLRLQPYIQRYHIEFVPLAIIGTCALFARWYPMRRTFVTSALALSFAWSGGVTYSINHFSMCNQTHETYDQLRTKLEALQASGEKPVIISVAPSWGDLTFLMPLSSAFDFPVLIVKRAFAHEELVAIQSLINDGYKPILAVNKQYNDNFFDSNRSWSYWNSVDHCYNYPRIGQLSPPLELATTCHEIRFYWPSSVKKSPPAGIANLIPSWRSRVTQAPGKNWLGLKGYGPQLCNSPRRPLAFQVSFRPETHFEPPVLTVNGKKVGTIVSKELAHSKSKSAHFVEATVPISELNCSDWNSIDVSFLPKEKGSPPRLGEIVYPISSQN
ncbi:MAG: hypothetical protein HY537_13355 [Deltaproteobacteria bacterium]|nr:hypothetical protein [Deltaproteobacteria bacterium]